MNRLGRLLAAGALLLVGSTPAASGASAADRSGECSSADGVTVVVDFTDLGGSVVVRCAGVGDMTGIQALERAGFSVDGTTRQGYAFVCRIDGRPGKDEKLAMDGNPGYTEQCVDTPPANAYWGYFSAADGGSWKYSTSGPSTHTAIPGGYEGWRFELNRSGGSAPPPDYRPVATPVTRTTAPSPTPTKSSAPRTSSSTSPSTASPSSTAAQRTKRHRARQHPKPTTTPATTPSASSTSPVAPSPSAAEAAVLAGQATGSDGSGGSSASGTLAAVAVIGLVALAGGGVAWRRSRRS